MTAAAPGLVLVHSPLLTASDWNAVVARLREQGRVAVVPEFEDALLAGSAVYSAIARGIAEKAEQLSGEIVLVGHSGAGALVPVVAKTIGSQVRGVLFVDAILPHPGKTWFDTVPQPLRTHLRRHARDGFLPRWHEWWPADVVEGLLPDCDARADFVKGLRPCPLAYFEAHAPAIELSPEISCSYLQLSSGYEAEADRARQMGWHVEHAELGHLAMRTNPDELSLRIQGLTENLGR